KGLGLQGLDKGVAIAVKVLANNLLDPLVEVVVGNLVALFFECLNDELAVDQILEGCGACLRDFLGQLFAAVLLAQEPFLGSGNASHLGIGNNITARCTVQADDSGDAIKDFGLSGQG